jgi:hypothetical protein
MGLLDILVGLGLLIWFAFRGWSDQPSRRIVGGSYFCAKNADSD